MASESPDPRLLLNSIREIIHGCEYECFPGFLLLHQSDLDQFQQIVSRGLIGDLLIALMIRNSINLTVVTESMEQDFPLTVIQLGSKLRSRLEQRFGKSLVPGFPSHVFPQTVDSFLKNGKLVTHEVTQI